MGFFSYKNHNTKVLSGGKVFQAHKDVLLVPGTQPVGPKPFENSIFRQKQACWIADVERPILHSLCVACSTSGYLT